MVGKNGLMEPFTKENGSIIKHRGEANFLIPMETITKEIGSMTKLMDMALMYTVKLELDIKDTGKTICSMDQEFRFIVMETSTRECLSKEKEMEKESIITRLEKSIKEDGLMEELKD